MLSLDKVPIDEVENWSSITPVNFRIHVNEFDDIYAREGRIWAVDVEPFSPNRRYFVIERITINCELKTSKLEETQPRAYLHGFGVVSKHGNRIRIHGKTYNV